MKKPDILIALHPVIEALERLSIQYYIGGSIASSIYGMARSTMDIDIVADIKKHHIQKLKQLLNKKYYIDENMIIEAIKSASSFNLIHFGTTFKIDIFIFKDDAYQRNAMKRKVKDKFDEEEFEYCFSSPEDIIIAKLKWYEQGDQISDRQWLDILGVIKVQGKNLDIVYLTNWSRKLGLFNLFKKACHECGINIQN